MIGKIKSQFFQKEFLTSNLSQLVNVLAMFLQTKLIVMYFSKVDFGNWSILMTYATMLHMLPFTAVNNAICRYAAEYREKKDEYVTSIMVGYSVVCIIQAVIFYILCSLNIIDFDFENYWLFFMLYCYAETMKTALFNIYTYFRQREKVLICYVVDLAFVVVGVGGMYIIRLITVRNILLFIFAKDIVVILMICTKLSLHIDKRAFREIYFKLIIFSLPIIFWNIFSYLQNVVNKWYLNINLTSDAVATYTVAVGVAVYIPTFYQTFVSSYFFPIIYAKNKKISTRKYLKYILIFAALIYTCFAASISILADLGLFEIMRLGLTRKIVIPKIVPGLFMTVAGFFLIPRMGLNGAIINYCIGQISYAVLCFATSIYVQSKYFKK